MQGQPSGYWEEMSILNRESRTVLMENKTLQQRLHDLNQQMNAKNIELYNLETRLENLDIFEQHLTSLNLRCEFLDKQVSNLENKQKTSSPSYNTDVYLTEITATTGLREFKDRSSLNIEWRTTETTFDNLCTEFKYLKEQLSIANNQTQLESSLNDISVLSHSSTDRSTSLFSESGMVLTDDGCNSVITANSRELSISKHTKPNPKHQTQKKKLLKMESFLNFYDNASINKEKECEKDKHQIGPLRGFNINTIQDNPLYEEESRQYKENLKTTHKITSTLGRKASAKSIKKKFQLASLPCIEEDNSGYADFAFHTGEESVNSKQKRFDLSKENDYIEHSMSFDQRFHRRHSSLPETSSLDGNNLNVASDESIRHFSSYDVGLNTKYANSKKYNITDFLFVKSKDMQNSTPTNTTDGMETHESCIVSSSPFSTFKASYIDDESFYDGRDENNKFTTQCVNSLTIVSDSDSDESYGDENATPLILKKESKLSLYKCKSHESIFSTMSKHTRNFPLRERNLDLKAQTMKWLKPNNPIVSSSVQPFVTSQNATIIKNAHDDIINILHSGGNNATESEPQTPIRDQSVSPKSFIPHKISSSPLPIQKNDSAEFNNNSDGQLSSWFSSLIPNSAFTNPEVGKLVGKPSAKNLEVKTSLSKSRGKAASFTLTPINFRKVRTNFNGPSSSLTINKNGERIITHGYGSGFNNSVVSSRVSHGALRDALESDMI